MTTMSLPADVRRLEQLYEAGLQDNFVEGALRKIVYRQIERDQAELGQLQNWLSEFEEKFGLSSSDFWREYRAGRMADTADHTEWNALLRSRERLLSRLSILKGGSADG